MAMTKYLADFIYGVSKYPCALFKPRVFIGHFDEEGHNLLQQEFFELLLDSGFKRTPWQLVFPGQTAGLIKRIKLPNTPANQYHVRFYNDGTIECEFEAHQWSIRHWSGPRLYGEQGKELLKEILEDLYISTERQNAFCELFGAKDFTQRCLRPLV